MSRHASGCSIVAIWVACSLLACASPEARRDRGGGRGADTGNRDTVVEMHEGSKMYYETPCLMPDDKCTGPLPVSGLPGTYPEPEREKS